MNSHVSLQVSLGGEGPGAYSALEWSLTSMCPVVHLKSRLARQDTMTYDTFVWIRQFVFNVVHQLLQLGGFT